MKIQFTIVFLIGLASGSLLGFLVFKWTFPALNPIKERTVVQPWASPSVQEIRSTLQRPNIPLILSHGSIIDIKNSQWQLKDVDNRIVSFSEFSGKTLFVNSWGTWCLPCVAEMPSIQALYDSLKNESVAFLVFSDEEIQILRSFALQERLTIPIYQSISEPPKPLVNFSWPTTFILNKSGSIVYSGTGGANWNHPDVIRFIRNLNQ